ncbi:Serine/threonine-protein kinase PBS1 [Vitis vinifera]|uniref:Serine/threonine-protein kinase PBS1 n=1 Tax=Vitis vinifera TaxID=29760 RepID=A0A438CNC3_VITVI|nr:Serine/threonine-protein kinase PBS1 [Vitis vinifera]
MQPSSCSLERLPLVEIIPPFAVGMEIQFVPCSGSTLVEALKEVPYKQVVARFSFAAFLPIKGHVFACGMNIHGQLGYGDTVDRRTLKIVELLEGVDPVGALDHGDEIGKTAPEILSSLKSHLAVQVCVWKRKTFVLVDTGSAYGLGQMGFGSFGFPDRGDSDKVTRPWILDNLRGHYISQMSTVYASEPLEYRHLDLPPNKELLDWNIRMKIVVGTIMRLEHLHDEASPSVIYEDFKSPNTSLEERNFWTCGFTISTELENSDITHPFPTKIAVLNANGEWVLPMTPQWPQAEG